MSYICYFLLKTRVSTFMEFLSFKLKITCNRSHACDFPKDIGCGLQQHLFIVFFVYIICLHLPYRLKRKCAEIDLIFGRLFFSNPLFSIVIFGE